MLASAVQNQTDLGGFYCADSGAAQRDAGVPCSGAAARPRSGLDSGVLSQLLIPLPAP